MSEAVEHGLNTLERKRASSDSGRRLERSPEEAWLACWNVLLLLILRNSVLRRWWCVLRRDRLIAGSGSLLRRRSGGLFVALAEEAAQEAGGVGGLWALLLELLDLLLKLVQARVGLIQSDVLDENGLSEHVQRVRVSGEALVEEGLCIGIFFLERCLV